MKRLPSATLIAIASVISLPAGAGQIVHADPIAYQLPEEFSGFQPGENLDVVQNNCTACHSSDYIATQPRGPAFGKSFWRAEVMKMIRNYGAPIEEGDVDKIVDYLTKTY